MKRLISPPVQTFLWLAGIGCLLASAWGVWQLRQIDVGQISAGTVKVDIPDASALAVPGIGRYRKLVEAPLFWEERAVPRKAPPPARVAVVQKAPEVIEVELNPPVGRLVGIVDLGDKLYALIRNEDDNKSLYKGDKWEGWTVSDIDANKMVLTAGKQRTEMALIGDFTAPKANRQMLASKQRRSQRKRQQQLRQQQRQRQARQASRAANRAANMTGPIPQIQPSGAADQLLQALGGATASGEAAQPAPVLSIKEALEARQRLMASRWGSNKPKEGNQ